jgi:SAM-dependent methyltransferase
MSTSMSEALYWKARAAITPGLENSQFAYAISLASNLQLSCKWLDLGCGHQILPDFVARRRHPMDLERTRIRAVGLDPDLRALQRNASMHLRVRGGGEALPFRGDSFDLVSANMVLEHVADPARLFGEVSRVLRSGGRFLVHTPNTGGYSTLMTRMVPQRHRRRAARVLHNRDEYDVYPTHYRANAESVLRNLSAAAGLLVQRLEFVETSAQLVAVPLLMLGELMLVRILRRRRLRRFRPCLIAEFEKS